MGVIGEQVVSIALSSFTPLFAVVRHCSIFCTVCFDPGLCVSELKLLLHHSLFQNLSSSGGSRGFNYGLGYRRLRSARSSGRQSSPRWKSRLKSRFKSLWGCSAFLAAVLTLRMAWFRRQPGRQAGLIFHRDRGNQYASRVFKEFSKSTTSHRFHEPAWQLLG